MHYKGSSIADAPKWRRYLRFYRENPVADLDDELRDHIESTIEVLMSTGMPPQEARDEAMRRFGDLDGIRREVQTLDQRHHRRGRIVEALEEFARDLRYGLRMLGRSPGFTLVAALSIALGVAANSTVFSVVNAVLLRPIPGTDSDRLVRVYVNHHSPFSWTDLAWFRDQSKSFEYLVGERYGAMSFRDAKGNEAERVRTSLVTRGYFNAFGVRMALGRPFDVDEKSPDASAPVVVLSHQFWQRRFGGDSSIIGKRISLVDHPAIVVGVLPRGFRSSVMTWTPEVFVPLAAAPTLTGVKLEEFGGSLYTTGRLRSDVRASDVESELQVLMSRLARTDSARYERMTVRLDHVRGVNAELRAAAVAASAFLMGMVGLVLLIACANVANLLLGRATSRQAEIGVRLAIGASRARLIRQLLTESLLLALIGGAAGLAVAWALTRSIAAALPAEAGLDLAFFQPDQRVLLFTGVMCLATTLLFGLVPALRASSPSVVPLLKSEAATGKRRKSGRLIATQAALCVVLLAIASLFVRSLQSIAQLDSGFRAAGVVDVTLDLGLLAADSTTEQATFARILDAAHSLPGVTSVTMAALVPLAGSNMETRVAPSGMTAKSRFDYPSTYFNVVAPEYFETLQIPIRAGRAIAKTDLATTGRVAVINETAARRWWPNEQALGKRFRWGGAEGEEVEVIGVAKDADYNMPGESARPFVYMPFSQERRNEMVLQLRTTASLKDVRSATWQMLRSIAPTLPPAPVVPMSDDMAITLMPIRAGAALLGTLGLVALLLAAAGIYGVTAYAVARRTREIGIRAALGAGRTRLLRLILGESLRPVTVGLCVGLALSLLAAYGLGRVLYGVHTVDPVVLPLVAIILGSVAVLAMFLPAWRAAAVDPATAIRSE